MYKLPRVLSDLPRAVCYSRHGNDIDSWFNASQLSWMVDSQGAHIQMNNVHSTRLVTFALLCRSIEPIVRVFGTGKLLVDDVYKLEELNDRFPELLNKLCAPSIEPSHANPSKHVHYSA